MPTFQHSSHSAPREWTPADERARPAFPHRDDDVVAARIRQKVIEASDLHYADLRHADLSDFYIRNVEIPGLRQVQVGVEEMPTTSGQGGSQACTHARAPIYGVSLEDLILHASRTPNGNLLVRAVLGGALFDETTKFSHRRNDEVLRGLDRCSKNVSPDASVDGINLKDYSLPSVPLELNARLAIDLPTRVREEGTKGAEWVRTQIDAAKQWFGRLGAGSQAEEVSPPQEPEPPVSSGGKGLKDQLMARVREMEQATRRFIEAALSRKGEPTVSATPSTAPPVPPEPEEEPSPTGTAAQPPFTAPPARTQGGRVRTMTRFSPSKGRTPPS